MMTMIGKIGLTAAAIACLLGGTGSAAGVRGRALLLDAPSRVTPGNLLLCFIKGDERKYETLVEGQVIDARFSPDGKQVIYALGGKIMTMDLAARAPREVGSYTAEVTYVNWGLGDKIYWSDGENPKSPNEIFCLDLKTKEKKSVHKGNAGRATVSLDGKRAAWVMPPVCALVGGKQFRYLGGCGGAVSPSGQYLTSNLTTTHMLMGIFTFGENGPSEKPVATVVSPGPYAFNGFYFCRADEWVCYVLEHPKNVSPTSYICYWRTNDHIKISEFGKYCIKDFIDESDVLPPDAQLEKIVVCCEGPTGTPLEHEVTNVGVERTLKVVGYFKSKDGEYTPQLREGVTWKADASKVAMTATSYKGAAESGRITVTAEYKGKTDSFDVSVLPALTGDGFKAEYFADATFTKSVLTRVDPYIDFNWAGSASPDPSVDGRKPWSVRWTGQLDVQTDGEYTFYFLQGEGNDKFLKGEGDEKKPGWGVFIDDKLEVTITKGWNYPWTKPKASKPIALKKGRHEIKAYSIDTSAHPVVAQLYWSGPGIKQSLLGGGYVHSGNGAAGKPSK